jgi:DNA-binding MarR family transcriptional regulator
MRIDAFLRQSPIVQTSRAARTMEASLNLVLQEEGVSVFEALMLAAIFFEKRGEIKPSALAESFETTRGNVRHCISSLEAKGLVARQIDPNDARAVQLLLKPQGRRRVVRVMGILDHMQRRFEDEVGADKLAAMMAQMRAVEKVCAGSE